MSSIAAAGQAQGPPAITAEPDFKISIDVGLVALNVSVRNGAGGITSGLTQRNFNIYEDGTLQTIKHFRAGDVPVAVGLIVDNSGSMRMKMSDVTAAAVAFARASNPNDDMFIVKFNERVTLGLPDRKLFSASASELEAALRNNLPAGETALYDAIGSSLAHIQQSGIEKKVLVAISDGGDNASRRTLEQVLDEVRRSDVEVYTIGLFDADDPDVNPRALRRIAQAGGGDAFLPKTPADAVQICERIAKDIRTQYTLFYSPSNQAFHGEYRTIRVRVAGENGAKLQARARAGYIAPPAPARDQGRK